VLLKGNRNWSLVHQAAKDGNVKLLDMLIVSGLDCNIADQKGWTALHVAVLHSQPAVVKMLLDKGAAIDTKTQHGWTVLHTAAKIYESANAEILRLLLSKCNDVNIPEKGGLTALDIAMEADNKVAVEILLEHNAISRKYRIGVGSSPDWTALHSCAFNQKPNVIPVLAKIIPIDSALKRNHWTPLHVAGVSSALATLTLYLARTGNHDVVKAVVDAGANVYLQDKGT
jgi:ankyrin repeat protein